MTETGDVEGLAPLLRFTQNPNRPSRCHQRLERLIGATDCNGGEGGIRTPDGLAPMPHFECGAFNRSATSPRAPFLARALDNGGPSRLQGQFAREIRTVFLLAGSSRRLVA